MGEDIFEKMLKDVLVSACEKDKEKENLQNCAEFMYSFYCSFVKAGFNEEQAMQLIQTFVLSQFNK